MDSHFLDDCGLEGHDHLYNELDQFRQEYLNTVSEKNGDPLDLSDGSGRETDFTVDETSSSGTQPNNEGTTVDKSSSDNDDFVTPVKLFLESGCGCRYGKNNSSCTISFSLKELVEHRMHCIELSSAELDLVLPRALFYSLEGTGIYKPWLACTSIGTSLVEKIACVFCSDDC